MPTSVRLRARPLTARSLPAVTHRSRCPQTQTKWTVDDPKQRAKQLEREGIAKSDANGDSGISPSEGDASYASPLPYEIDVHGGIFENTPVVSAIDGRGR